jgi:predicted alpha/beta-fold hydrolase
MSNPSFELLDTIWTRPTLVILSGDQPIIETENIENYQLI